MDLLLHLIREHEINIYDIPISTITQQYLDYLDMMETLDLDIAGEYLVMAATLTYIKSRILLPKTEEGIESEEEEIVDPREELVRRLLEYKRFKDAAETLRTMEQQQSRVYQRPPLVMEDDVQDYLEEVSIFDLLTAFKKVLDAIESADALEITLDEISVTDKINFILERLEQESRIEFEQLFESGQGRADLIATFLAILELMKIRMIRVAQPSFLGTILLFKNPEEETNGSN